MYTDYNLWCGYTCRLCCQSIYLGCKNNNKSHTFCLGKCVASLKLKMLKLYFIKQLKKFWSHIGPDIGTVFILRVSPKLLIFYAKKVNYGQYLTHVLNICKMLPENNLLSFWARIGPNGLLNKTVIEFKIINFLTQKKKKKKEWFK